MHRAQWSTVRGFLAVLLVPLLAAALTTALAQTAAKTLHIGILSSGTHENRNSLEQSLVQGLRDQGYIEGKNLIIERRYGWSKAKENAAELAGMKLDAVMTTCTPSTRIMKEASSLTPIVMAAVSDPVGQGIVTSLAKPGQNVTGTSSQAEDLLAKRLELLAGLLPSSRTIAVLTNANNPVHTLSWRRLEVAARALSLNLVKVEIGKPDELLAAMESAMQAGPNALFVMPDDPMMFNIRAQIVEAAAKNRLPDFYWASQFVEAGGLMSYGESLRESYHATAAYLDRIVKGARPGDLPVTQPTRFEMVINLRTARTLALDVPRPLLMRANSLID